MSATEWKEQLLPGAGNGRAPAGYERRGGILGRAELLADAGRRDWWDGEFSGRASVPHTTSALEAEIRRRRVGQLVEDFGVDRRQPALELGCADGLVTRHLLELGFEKLISTDIEYPSVVKLEASLRAEDRDRVLPVVDDLLRLPFAEATFATVIAWGVLSVSGDFDRTLELAWGWVAPGGHLLFAEPILESVLAYTLVRGDLSEFRRTLREGTRAAMWDTREDRYPVNPLRFYADRLQSLPDATIVDAGGISMLPSLVHGGRLQEAPVGDEERAELTALLGDPDLDELSLWRQAFWLVRRR